MNYAVTINLPQGKWIDHLGREIEAITLAKGFPNGSLGSTHGFNAKSVWYNPRTFGVLARALGEIPESPVQELSDWTVTMDSIFSDGDFSTMDLLYHLKVLNEGNREDGKEFDFVGCPAVLWTYQGAERKILYRCSVVAVSSENGTTSITFSETIGAPVIAKEAAPIIFGNSAGDDDMYWPVKLTTNEFNQKEIILSEEPFKSSCEFFIYLEKEKEYRQVAIGNFIKSEFETKIIFTKNSDIKTFINANPAIEPGDQLFSLPGSANILRQDRNNPTNCVLGYSSNEELIQIWTNNVTVGSSSETYPKVRIRRPPHLKDQKSYATPAPVKISENPTPTASIILYDTPLDISDASTHANCRADGDPNHFLYGVPVGSLSDYPRFHLSYESIDALHIYGFGEFALAVFNLRIKFPDHELPPGSTLLSVCFFPFFTFSGYSLMSSFKIGEKTFTTNNFNFAGNSIRRSLDSSSSNPLRNRVLAAQEKISFSDTQLLQFDFRITRSGWKNDPDRNDFLELRGMVLERTVQFPINEDTKLYTRGRNSGGNNGNNVISAAQSLLSAARISNYAVTPQGELDNTAINSIMTEESAELRAKLKTLAIASSTFIKSDPLQRNKFIVSTLNLEKLKNAAGEIERFEIPFPCVAMENNMYCFSLRTQMKDQIYSGLEISYKKNIATGKYEHRILVNELGVQHDNAYGCEGSADASQWAILISRLRRNAANGINNLKSIENEWIRDKAGAEIAAYNYLSWCCAPLYTAQVKCVSQLFPSEIDIGSLVYLDFPKYAKLKEITWMVTAVSVDLESHRTTVTLLEKWNAKVQPEAGYILTEDLNYINTNNERHLKLEE